VVVVVAIVGSFWGPALGCMPCADGAQCKTYRRVCQLLTF
jgi:hypothetical protein